MMEQKNENNADLRFVNQAEEIDIKEVLLVLWSHKKFILLVMLFAMFISGLYVVNKAPQYKVNALIQVANNPNSGISGILSDSTLASYLLSGSGSAQPSEIETALLHSRFILQPTIDKQKLNIVVEPKFFPIFGNFLARRHENKNLATGQSAVAEPKFGLKSYAWGGQSLEVAKFDIPSFLYGKKFRIIAGDNGRYQLYTGSGKVLLTGKVGQLAEGKINGSLDIRLLISKLAANKGARFTITREAYEKTLAQLTKSLTVTDLGNKNETGVLSLTLKGTNPWLLPKVLNAIVNNAAEDNIKSRSQQAKKTLTFLNKQLPQIKSGLSKAELQLNKYRSKNGMLDVSSEGTVLLNQIVSIEQTLDQLKLQKAELLQGYTNKHPVIVASQEKVRKLSGVLLALKNRVKQLPLREQKAIQLEREVKVKNQLYLLLLDRIQQLQMVKAGTISDVKILNMSTDAIAISGHKLLILLGGLFLGFILAVIIIFLRKMLLSRVENPELVEEVLQVAGLATVPHSKQQDFLSKQMKRGIMSTENTFVLAEYKPRDLAVESIRSLRTTLDFSLGKVKNQIISVMGASPSIGKSFISANLTHIYAEGGKRVLLVDADLRRGKLDKYLSAKKTPGLSDILQKRITVAQGIQSLRGKNIDFIAAGSFPDNPGRIFISENLEDFFAQLKDRYDVIVIDTPPVLSLADSIVISKYASRNLLLVGSGRDTMHELKNSVKKVHKVGAKVHGLVFNNTQRKNNSYYYYNYYAYKYE